MTSRFENIDHYRSLICLDCEFTCWKDSLDAGWPDPDFPPELIQIGLSVYNVPAFALIDEFVSFVSPMVNPTLSEYCKDLLNVSQESVNNATMFSEIANDITIFFESNVVSEALVCSFGAQDWEIIASDSIRHSVSDPLTQFEKLDLKVEAARILGYDRYSITRELIYKKFGLSGCNKRHDALYDARDLIRIINLLHHYQESSETSRENIKETK
jgi:inhibitor of KinA sporulation pathway (predicted exonuclease)